MKAQVGQDECDARRDALVRRSLAATVSVEPADYDPSGTGVKDKRFGTGVIINGRGWVLTANHVVAGARYAVVTVQHIGSKGGGLAFAWRGDIIMRVAITAPEYDAALLIPLDRWTAFSDPAEHWGIYADLVPGELVWHFGRSSVGKSGQIHLLGTEFQGIKGLMTITAPAVMGDSGGPVFDRHGRLIGLVIAHGTLGSEESLTFCVPVMTAISALIGAGEEALEKAREDAPTTSP
ncbi:hypothetical protein AMJ57_04195 [Parcubacteria bacterium SG8_24]|nr:MAG: hypothetical protein AMJ57_04195 [Parcubacteria bacterium SG8_24]